MRDSAKVAGGRAGGAASKANITAGKAMLFTAIIVFGLLVTAEGAIRTWAYYFRSTYESYNAEKGRYEPVPGIHHISGSPPLVINSKGFIGPEFEDKKPSNVYRIFAIGDSCTFGAMSFAYPGLLHHRLNKDAQGRKFEVINAGVEGYHSGFALARLKEDVLQYKPDLVTIYVGWNDFMKLNPESRGESGGVAWLGRLMEQSYLIKAYKKVLFSYIRPLILKPNVASAPEDLHAYDAFEPVEFRNNLSEMVRLLKSNKSKVLIMTRPTVVHEGMSYEEVVRQNVVFPWYGSAYSVNKLLSLHRAYNRVIRHVAEQEAIPLVDLDAAFEPLNRNDLFWDTMHPNEKGQAIIADQVYRTLTGMIGAA